MALWYDGLAVKVEIGFTSTPSTAVGSITWTDVTAYVRSIDMTRGRAYERDQFAAGSCSVVLSNADRRFDPENASSPYSPGVVPMRPLRVQYLHNLQTNTRFVGYIQAFPQTWDLSNTDATTTVLALDALAILGLMALPESRYYAQIIADLSGSIRGYYRLGEEIGSTLALDSSGNGRHAYYGDGNMALVGALPSFTNDGARQITGSGSKTSAVSGGGFAYVAGTDWSWETWLTFPSLSAGVTLDYWTQRGSLVPAFSVQINVVSGIHKLLISADDGAGTTLFADYVVSAGDGARHHVVVTRSGATWALYIDGGAVSPTITGGFTAGATTFGSTPILNARQNTGTLVSWTVDELAIYGVALNATQVANHFAAGSGTAGQTVTARLTQVLADAGYTGATAGDASVQTVRGADYGGGTNLLSYLQSLERTERGRIFVARNGDLTFHARYHDLVNNTIAAALSDAVASTLQYREAQHDYTVTRVYNDVTASRVNGRPQRFTSAASVTLNGTRSLTIDGLQGQSDPEVADRAAYEVQLSASPVTRYPAVTIYPRRAPATWFATIPGIDIGAKITLARTPQGTGTTISKTLIVEGITEHITPQGDWAVTWTTSPVDDTNGNFLVLDDATRGQLDSNRLGF